MNVTIKCKKCQSLLSVKEKREEYIYKCINCSAHFLMEFRFGILIVNLFVPVISLILSYFLSGGNDSLFVIYNVVIWIFFISIFIYRPYTMKISKSENDKDE